MLVVDKELTISSLQMGHKSFVLAAVTDEAPPFCNDTTELKSCALSGKGDVAKGLADDWLEETTLSAGDEISETFRW